MNTADAQRILELQQQLSELENELNEYYPPLHQFDVFKEVCCGQGVDVNTDSVIAFLRQYRDHLAHILDLKPDSEKIESIIQTISNVADNENEVITNNRDGFDNIKQKERVIKKEINDILQNNNLV